MTWSGWSTRLVTCNWLNHLTYPVPSVSLVNSVNRPCFRMLSHPPTAGLGRNREERWAGPLQSRYRLYPAVRVGPAKLPGSMEILTPNDYRTGRRKRPRRRDRPCDACRKRKTRCVMKAGEETCVHCQLRRSTCTFEHDPPDRASMGEASPAVSMNMSRRAAVDSSGLSAGRNNDASGRMGGTPSPMERGEEVSKSSSSTVVPIPAKESGPYGMGAEMTPTVSGPTSTRYDDFGLGMSQTRFAELYGLGSDMEPVLMVSSPSPSTQV